MQKMTLAGLVLGALMFCAAGGVRAASESSMPKPDSTPVLIGVTPDTSYAPFFVAVDRGFLKAEGVNAAYRLGQGADGTQNVMAGAEQMAANSELPVLLNRAKGGRFQCVATTLSAAQQIGAAAIGSIKKPTDLYGQTVGVPFGTGGQYFFEKYVNHYHLDKSKIHVRNVGAAELLPALARGDIAAFFSWQPWISKAAQLKHGAHVLAVSGTDNIYTMRYCLVAGTAFATQHPALVRATLKGLMAATAWMRQHPKQAAEVVSKDIRLPVAETEHLMSMMTYPIELTQADYEDFVSVGHWLKNRGTIAKNTDVNKLVSGLFAPGYLRSVAPAAVTLK